MVLLANRVAAASSAPTTQEGEASGRRRSRSSMTLPPSEDLGRRLSSMLLPAPPPPLDGLWLAHCHIGDKAVRQGLALVHFSAQRKHFLWDTLGTVSRQMGHNSTQTGHKTAD